MRLVRVQTQVQARALTAPYSLSRDACRSSLDPRFVRTSGGVVTFGYLTVKASRSKLTVDAIQVDWACTNGE